MRLPPPVEGERGSEGGKEKEREGMKKEKEGE